MTAQIGKPTGSSGMISIGALSKASGIPVETLRTWERRYGFPAPIRKPSGHRLYPVSAILRLRRIAQAVTRGHRIGDIIHATEEELWSLLESSANPPEPSVARPHGPAGPADLAATLEPADQVERALRTIETFDAEALTHQLLLAWARLGSIPFLERFVGPLLQQVGRGWEEGRFGIRHEHFLSERIQDLLRTLRLPMDERARGPLVIMATLPGEEHTLGLEMAALVLAQAGMRVLYLGAEVPETELAVLARQRMARAIAISVSAHASSPEMRERIGALRSSLPKSVTLLVGGEGFAELADALIVHDFQSAEAWARSL